MEYGNYRYIKRILAGVMAIVLWLASINFSLDGFGLQISAENRASMMWIGWALALFVTVMELTWNSPDARTVITLFIMGIIAYGYGWYTNTMGFYSMQGGTLEALSENPFSIVFAAVVGFIAEVVPEALLMWAILDGRNAEESDFVGNILGLHEKHSVRNPIVQNKANSQPYKPEPMFQSRERQTPQFQAQNQPKRPPMEEPNYGRLGKRE